MVCLFVEVSDLKPYQLYLPPKPDLLQHWQERLKDGNFVVRRLGFSLIDNIVDELVAFEFVAQVCVVLEDEEVADDHLVETFELLEELDGV